jgi:hypothetical protein
MARILQPIVRTLHVIWERNNGLIMDAQTALEFQQKKRIGFHYYPDALHYRYQDLKNWLPELKAMQTSWMLLIAPPDRAIPEPFIRGLIQNKIEPVLHFNCTAEALGAPQNVEPLIRAYSRWGVKKIIFFAQPNLRTSWSASGWTKKNLVEQFLDRFIPFANLALQYGITPVFPPLHPGGDYWDTVFLRAALKKLLSRDEALADQMQLAAYAWTWEKSLNWGAGGPQIWTNHRPYSEPTEPDQRGFRAFEWYNQICDDILGKSLPVFLLGAGLQYPPQQKQDSRYFQKDLTNTVLTIVKLMAGQEVITNDMANELLEPAAGNIVSAFYWLLSAAPGDPYENQAWYKASEEKLPVVSAFQRWCAESVEADEKVWRENRKNLARQEPRPVQTPPAEIKTSVKKEERISDHVTTGVLTFEPELVSAGEASEEEEFSPAETLKSPEPATPVRTVQTPKAKFQGGKLPNFVRPIDHYLLLPLYEWGVADWHLEVIRPFIKKHRVTVGFSIREAALAKQVTVVGNVQSFPEELLEKLRATGCEVNRIQGDGQSIASQLATR